MADNLKIDFKNMGFYFGADKETMHKRAKSLHQTVLYTDKAEYHFYDDPNTNLLTMYIELVDNDKKPMYGKFEKIEIGSGVLGNFSYYKGAKTLEDFMVCKNLGDLTKWELYDLVLIIVSNWLLDEYLKINKHDRKEIRKKNKKKKKEKE